MCGRYAFTTLKRASRLLELPIEEFLDARFNIAPTQLAPIILPKSQGGVERVEARWGLVPRWAKELPHYPTFNARLESVAVKPTFRQAWKDGQRCLVPATGIYEWRLEAGKKQPYFISKANGEELLMAGLWEPCGIEGGWGLTFTILTGLPAPLVAPIHDRQAVLLGDQQALAWLRGGKRSDQEWMDLLNAAVEENLQAWPVSAAVNSPRADGPQLMLPTGPLLGAG